MAARQARSMGGATKIWDQGIKRKCEKIRIQTTQQTAQRRRNKKFYGWARESYTGPKEKYPGIV